MSLVQRVDADGVTTLTLDRAAKRNALNLAMFAALDDHLAAIEADDGIAVVVLRAAGPVFCAGADLSARETPPRPRYQASVIDRLAALPRPVIAAVHGDCLTGGLELVLAADLIVAAESARFADTHARWGVMPEWGMTQRLPHRIGQSRAALMAFAGETIDARTAERWGLVDRCWPDDAFEPGLATLIARIAGQSRHSLAGYKRLFRETADLPLAEGLAWEITHGAGTAPDFRERVAGHFGRQENE